MSRAGRRRALTGAVRAGIAIAALLVTGATCAAAAPWILARLSGPVALDRPYRVIVPNRREQEVGAASAARSGRVDGLLALETRAFGQPEVLVPEVGTPVAALVIGLGRASAPISLNSRAPDGRTGQAALLTPEGWSEGDDAALHPYATPGVAHIELRDGRGWVDGQRAGPGNVGDVELLAHGHGRITRLTLLDAQGGVILDDTFAPRTPEPQERLAVAAVGALLAGLTLLGLRERGARALPGVLVALALPLIALFTPYGTWRDGIERFYLGGLDLPTLRVGAFALVSLPLFSLGILRSGLLRAATRPDAPLVALLAACALLSAIGARGLSGPWLLAAIPGFFVLAAPLWLAQKSEQGLGHAALRDLPAALGVAIFGWPVGLLPLAGWRLLCLAADAPRLLRRHAEPGADVLFFTLLLFPVGVEAALRASPLGVAWSPETLAGASAGETGGGSFDPFWTDHCGEGGRTLYAFGGSSTGGAYQFEGHPEAFFIAQAHARLCAAGQAIETLNYGNSGRDTWDIHLAAPGLFAARKPDVVLVYAGVNDLLTKDSPLTRKQRAARLGDRTGALGLLDQVGSLSRTLTGLALAFRPQEEGKLVQAVPLEDAEANLRALATATQERGGTLLLVPELSRKTYSAHLTRYAGMMKKIAEDTPGVRFFDLHTVLGEDVDALMADRNHLDEAGSVKVGEALVPVLTEALAAP